MQHCSIRIFFRTRIIINTAFEIIIRLSSPSCNSECLLLQQLLYFQRMLAVLQFLVRCGNLMPLSNMSQNFISEPPLKYKPYQRLILPVLNSLLFLNRLLHMCISNIYVFEPRYLRLWSVFQTSVNHRSSLYRTSTK